MTAWNNTETMIDKINLFHLAVVGTGAGVYHWLSTNHIGFWISLITGVLILLLTIRKVITTLASDYRKWSAGKLFEKPNKDNLSEHGN